MKLLLTEKTLRKALEYFAEQPAIAIDTETYGVRPYHGDRLFSIILFDGKKQAYFNFHDYDRDDIPFLDRSFLKEMNDVLFSKEKLWIGHNFKFELHMLGIEGIDLLGKHHCTMVMERCLHYTQSAFDLNTIAKQYGTHKVDAVKRWIDSNSIAKSFEKVWFRKDPIEHQHFDRVPPELMVPYGIQDAISTFKIYQMQIEKAKRLQALQPNFKTFYDNEMRLISTVYRMEKKGVRVDLPYVKRAIAYERLAHDKARREFEDKVGEPFLNSTIQNQKLFQTKKHLWSWGKPTKVKKQINPKWDEDALKRFKDPIADLIIKIKQTDSRLKFYGALEYHTATDGRVHTSLNQHQARTGRFSSSRPNLQNLKKDKGEDLKKTYIPRRALIPDDNKSFIAIDYDQIEYKLLLDYANPKTLVAKVLDGYDVHEATGLLAGIDRGSAKAVNFGCVYGIGDVVLSKDLGKTIEEVKQIKNHVFSESPEILRYMDAVKDKLKKRGWIFTWIGRVIKMPDRNTHYKGVNAHIQGGAADIMKKALNHLDEFTSWIDGLDLVLTVHDEAILEIDSTMIDDTMIRELIEIMVKVYPHKHLPITAGAEVSDKSLADKKEYEYGAI